MMDWASPTESPTFTAECYKLLVMAGITANSQKPMLKATTLQVVIKLTSDITRQLFALCG